MKPLVVVEFFCGTKSLTKAAEKRGHKCFTIDFNKKHNPDLCIDIIDFSIDMLPKEFRKPDLAWFSPPCTTFSVCMISRHFKNGRPISSACYIGLALVMKSLEIIKQLKPKYYFIENPRGMLRKQHFMQNLVRRTVTYCQYGDKNMKPTDIWTNAVHWIPRKMCKAGDTCHEYQPRTYKQKIRSGVVGLGVQGLKNSEERGIIPVILCEEIISIVETKPAFEQKILRW